MAPARTVQQLFGLKPEELNALTVLSGLEGYRAPGSLDPAAVAASTLQRRLSGKWGGVDIRNIATAPGQFEAIFGRKINMQQLGDPAFGAKILGGQSEFQRLQSMINDPNIIRSQMGKVGESFRAYSSGPKPGDYVPVPGKSNFYFDRNPDIAKKGLQILGAPGPVVAQQPAPAPQPGVLDTLTSVLGFNPAQQKSTNLAQQLLEQTKQQLIQKLMPNIFMGITPTTGDL